MDDLLRRHAVGNDEAHVAQIEEIKKRASILETLEGGPKQLAAITKTMDDASLRQKPAPDKWSAIEVACHLRDIERLWADRLVKTAFTDKPTFYALDGDGIAVKSAYNSQDPASAVKEYARLREDNLRLLRTLPARQWTRSAIHPKRGEIDVHKIVEIMIDHDARHFEQMKSAAAV
jgi:uncharacterized damage-inducible protein DinB